MPKQAKKRKVVVESDSEEEIHNEATQFSNECDELFQTHDLYEIIGVADTNKANVSACTFV
jgi:hypothetical protein